MLSRDEFCKLLKLSSDDLKNRNRRGQLPFLDQHRPRGEYSPYEALLVLLTEDLADSPIRSNLTAAANSVGFAAQYLVHKLDAVGETSLDLREGRDTNEIFVSIVWLPFGGADRECYIGTFREISDAILAAGRPIIREVKLNASRAASQLRARASRANIDISDLWGEDA
jgi:hypothetical protein